MNPIENIRQYFPILNRKINGKPLTYLDSAATTLKPKPVVEAISKHYLLETSNIHRGVHTLSEQATDAYEKTREKVKSFINAKHHHEIVFTSGTTDSINLVAQSYGKNFLKKGDAVLITHMEHHSNIVPWQLLKEQNETNLDVIPINQMGEINLEAFEKKISNQTKLISVVYYSNSLGTINPIKKIIHIAHEKNIPVLIDAAQAMLHTSIDVQALDVDFLAFSAHKMFGPTGLGVLYAKESLLEKMPPYRGGGDMILSVDFEKTIFNELPYKFEAGTPPIAQVIGFGAAIDFIQKFSWKTISSHEKELFDYTQKKLKKIKDLKIIGEAKNKNSVFSFVLKGIHPHDIGSILDQEGIAIRTGHHCTQPIMKYYNIPATARASLSLYNTKEDIDTLVKGIKKVIKIFS